MQIIKQLSDTVPLEQSSFHPPGTNLFEGNPGKKAVTEKDTLRISFISCQQSSKSGNFKKSSTEFASALKKKKRKAAESQKIRPTTHELPL